MPTRVFHFYQRHRIVNVNLNIIGGGLLAIALSKFPVLWVTAWIGPEHKLINSIVAAIIDGVADVIIYFGLHWIANHWRPIKPDKASGKPKESFWREATLVQFERLALTPAFYVIAIGGMWGLQHLDMPASWAFVLAFSAAIIMTRLAHTAWCLKTGRFEPIPMDEFRFVKAPKVEDALEDEQDPACKAGPPGN